MLTHRQAFCGNTLVTLVFWFPAFLPGHLDPLTFDQSLNPSGNLSPRYVCVSRLSETEKRSRQRPPGQTLGGSMGGKEDPSPQGKDERESHATLSYWQAKDKVKTELLRSSRISTVSGTLLAFKP